MRKVVISSILFSALVSSYILWIGVQHDSMREFCIDPDAIECELDYLYASGVWFSWSVFIGLPLALIFLVGKLLFKVTPKVKE